MRRLGMKNKHRKSEMTSDSESEENVGARAASDNAGNDETQAGRNNNAQKSATKRRSSRGASVQKPAAQSDDGAEMDTEAIESEERENGEKVTAGQKSPLNKRRKKDQRASTSARDKSRSENEYEVWRQCSLYPFPPSSACRRLFGLVRRERETG